MIGRAIPGEVLASTAVVVRAVSRKAQFIPEGARLPTHCAFEPSDVDKEEAQSGNHPVRLSVYDTALTTPEQAVGFRSVEAVPFLLPVGIAAEIAKRYNEHRFRVVRDPDDPSAHGPGADGHCGIEGLERDKPRVTRPTHRAFLSDLAAACSPATLRSHQSEHVVPPSSTADVLPVD